MSDPPHRGLPRIFHVAGGLPDENVDPTAGEHRWRRLPDETAAQFRDRVIAAAAASREPVLIFREVP